MLFWRTEDKEMIMYLDTSSLVKLYVEEEGSSKVADLVRSSSVTATSLIAYAEARASFARRYREQAFTGAQHTCLVSALNEDWDNYLIIRVTKELVQLAGDLAETHGLRGFDAIHLSSALTLRRRDSSSPIIFSCADQKLQKASELEHLGQPQ